MMCFILLLLSFLTFGLVALSKMQAERPEEVVSPSPTPSLASPSSASPEPSLLRSSPSPPVAGTTPARATPAPTQSEPMKPNAVVIVAMDTNSVKHVYDKNTVSNADVIFAMIKGDTELS